MRPSTTDLQWLACDVDLWLRKVCFARRVLWMSDHGLF
jgi:hypothetical protein